jgi:hypothetical protein
MTTQFRTLFTVTIAHPYYNRGGRDFDFIVPAGTARGLASAKLLAKSLDGKLHVLFETDVAGAALVPAPGAKLRFGLRLSNVFFGNFTAFNFHPGSFAALYRNAAAPGALAAPEKVVPVGRLFSHSLTKATRPVTAALKNASGQNLQSDAITAAADRAAVSYDLSGQNAGLYKVEETYPGDTASVLYYSDSELAQLGVFGIVEIEIAAAFYAAAANFTIPFAAREETLKYYVVAKSYTDAELDQLSIADEGFTKDARPQVKFTKVPSAAFAAGDLPAALLAKGDDKLVLFKSQGAVARREKARKKIQLKKNDDVLIEHLPQPGPEQMTADLIIQISKP